MAEKDMAEKTLISINEVFADIVNGLLFEGEELVAPSELKQAMPVSVYKADGKLREQERDTAKYWEGKCGFRIAFFGIENETEAEDDIPLRVIGYDGAAYRAQLYREKDAQGKWRQNRNPRYGVVTLVLYFGYRKRWDRARTLHENLCGLPERLKPYVSDYRVNVFEIAYLSEEEAERFKSDFRIVVDYFTQMRETGRYEPRVDEVRNPREIFQLMSVLAGDSRFEEAYHEASKEKKELRRMSEALNWIEQKGYEKGERSGYEKGERSGSIKGAVNIYREELGLDNPAIVHKLTSRYHLTEEQAWQYVEPGKSA